MSQLEQKHAGAPWIVVNNMTNDFTYRFVQQKDTWIGYKVNAHRYSALLTATLFLFFFKHNQKTKTKGKKGKERK